MTTISRIVEHNQKSGGHFFDRDTMQAFATRVMPGVYEGAGGVFFITSDNTGPNKAHRYTVRTYNPANGHVWTPYPPTKTPRLGEAIDAARYKAATVPEQEAA